MSYIVITSAVAQRKLAQVVGTELQNTGFAVWLEDVPDEDLLAPEVLREVVESADVIVVVAPEQSTRDRRVAYQLQVAQASAVPVLTINSLEQLPALRNQLRDFVAPTPMGGAQPVLLPQPLSSDEIDEMNARAAVELRRVRVSNLSVLGALGMIGVVILVIASFPIIRGPLEALGLFGENVEPTVVATPRPQASFTPVAPTVEPTVAPSATVTLVPSETSVLVGIVTFTPTAESLTSEPSGQDVTQIVTRTQPATDTPSPTGTVEPTETPTVIASPTGIASGADNRLWTPQYDLIEDIPVVTVPAGCMMVDTEDDVCFDRYAISQTEITNAQYARCVGAGGCTPPEDFASRTRDNYYDDRRFADYPVINITWEQARAYADWIGGALPTQDQWRYAAAGPEGWLYPWGEDEPNPALLNFNGFVGDTTRVGEYPAGASWVGAVDLAGNVWEWTFTEQDETSVLVAGGSWTSHAGLVGTDVTAANPRDDANAFTGFRVIFDAEWVDDGA